MYHFQDLSTNNHSNRHMQKDYNQGHDFSWKILKEVKNSKNLDDEERGAIAYHNSFYEGYNSTPGGEYDQHKGRWDTYDRLPVSKYKSIKWTKCNKCQKEIIKGYRNCPYCGEELRKRNGKINQPEDKGKWKICPKCNRINFDNEKCYFCNEKITSNNTDFNQFEEKTKTKKPINKNLDKTNYKDMKIKHGGTEWYKFSRRMKYNPFVKRTLLKQQQNKCAHCEKTLDLKNSVIAYTDYDNTCTNSKELKIPIPTPKRPNKTIAVGDCENCERIDECFSKLKLIHKTCNTRSNKKIKNNDASQIHEKQLYKSNLKDMQLKYNRDENWKKFTKKMYYNPYINEKLFEKQSEKCAYCDEPIGDKKSMIRIIDYDNTCTYDGVIELQMNKRTKRKKEIPDCENCEKQTECMSKAILLHKTCNKELKKILKEKNPQEKHEIKTLLKNKYEN